MDYNLVDFDKESVEPPFNEYICDGCQEEGIECDKCGNVIEDEDCYCNPLTTIHLCEKCFLKLSKGSVGKKHE